MFFYMLNPKDITDVRGVTTDAQVMWELGITNVRFKTLLDHQEPFYKDSILVEVAPDENREEQFDEVLVYTNKRGTRYYICRDCTLKRVYRSGAVQIAKPWRHHNTYECKLANNSVNAGRLIAKAFLKPDLSDDDVVIVHGELKLKNIEIRNAKEWKAEVGPRSSLDRTKKIGYFENGKLVKVYPSSRKASKELPLNFQSILDTCHGKVKKPSLDVRFIE